MEDRRKNGLCSNYDELFALGHVCKKLFWLEIKEKDMENSRGKKEGDSEISIHAITGATTMLVSLDFPYSSSSIMAAPIASLTNHWSANPLYK